MFALIGNLAHPTIQMRLERRPALKAAISDRVLLDVANPALLLAFRTYPIGRAGSLFEALRKAYEAAPKVRFAGARYRTDIGWRALEMRKTASGG